MHVNRHLLLLSAVILCVSCASFLDQEWNMWKTKFAKRYPTSYDETLRRKVWEENWHKVEKHNQMYEQRLTKYKKGMNTFSDMTSEEFKSKKCVSTDKVNYVHQNLPVRSHSRNINLPESVDWRKENCVTRVKNQGLCGSCWAFATVGVFESHNCIRTKELLEFSEQQLVDCDSANEGCCGGVPANALNYVSTYGVMKAKDYEYAQMQAACSFKNDNAIKFNVTKSYVLLTEDNMASSVALEGPLAVGIDASDDFGQYKEGIFTGGCTQKPSHAVIIVGYGSETDKDSGEKTDYWIIKNSWGEEWGDKGYIRMQRNADLCGITSMAASVDFEHN